MRNVLEGRFWPPATTEATDSLLFVSFTKEYFLAWREKPSTEQFVVHRVIVNARFDIGVTVHDAISLFAEHSVIVPIIERRAAM